MKILVVDDEPLVAQYFIQCVRAASPADEVIGAVRSGAQALRLLEGTVADLIFVDITMPKMDGLELLRKIKERYPAASVVMLTCHEEFEYARAAIQSKADDYVLKNEVNPEMLATLLDRLRRTREARHSRQAEDYSRRNKYLRRLVEGDHSLRPVREGDLRWAQVGLEMRAFCVFVFRELEGNRLMLWQRLADRQQNPVLYAYGEKDRFLLTNLRGDVPAEELAGLPGCLTGAAGRSRIYQYAEQLPDAIQEALSDRSQRFYGTADGMLGYRDSAARLEPYAIRAAARLEEGDAGGACAELEAMLAFSERTHPQPPLLQEALLRYFPEDGADGGLRAALDRCRTFQELSGCAQDCMELLRMRDLRYSAPIRRAMEYIERHYAEDISLNMVADVVYWNRDYLSRQFKKEVGVNFSEYLMSVRLRRARRLLETTDLRVSDAAQQVGITNLSYFSTVFHKFFGCKPGDIRKMRKRHLPPDRDMS